MATNQLVHVGATKDESDRGRSHRIAFPDNRRSSDYGVWRTPILRSYEFLLGRILTCKRGFSTARGDTSSFHSCVISGLLEATRWYSADPCKARQNRGTEADQAANATWVKGG